MTSPRRIPTGRFSPSSRSRIAAAFALLFASACASADSAGSPEAVTGLSLAASHYTALEGWRAIDARPALHALARSCERDEARPDDALLNPRAPYAGRVGDWRSVCAEALVLDQADVSSEDARAFFETRFTPVAARGAGRLTGYYEPVVDVRARPDEEFSMAIRARPEDLLTGDLGQFIASLEGQRVMGRAADQRFEPYRSRADIEALNLGVPLAWGRPIDVFFLQIQGSGRLRFEDGSIARAAFAAHNGLPYVSIGRILVERGELTLDNASKQDIKAWLRANGPDAWRDLFNENPRYVFFRLESIADPQQGPAGSHGAPLTPMASLAVDRSHHALGVPVFLTADLYDEPGWRGLVVAQDAGGAILGPLRGDLFFGFGAPAGERAGRQNATNARWTLLLPHAVAARIGRRT